MDLHILERLKAPVKLWDFEDTSNLSEQISLPLKYFDFMLPKWASTCTYENGNLITAHPRMFTEMYILHE